MVVLGALLLIAALIAGVGVLVMNANTATDESLHVFGYVFGTTPAGGFLIGALVGAVALAGLALIASRLLGSAGRRNATKQVEAERAALTEKHQKELAGLHAQAEEDRAALIEEHETDLARHRQEAETQRVTLAEQHQRELERQSKEAEAERSELTRHHEEQLALGKQAVRDALERALGSSGESVADKPAAHHLGTTAGAVGAATVVGGSAMAASATERSGTETSDTERSDTERSDTERSDTERSDTERSDTERSDTGRSETDKSHAESWERAFGDKTDVGERNVGERNVDERNVGERNVDKTDVDESTVHTTDVDNPHVDETRDEVNETRNETVAPLGWHREVDDPHEANGHQTGRHRETGETNDEAPHKNLWQRVVSAVDQRRHD